MLFIHRKNLLVLFLLTAFFIACVKVPVTGRRQLNLLPESTLRNMAVTQYQGFLRSNKVVPANNENTQMVKRVGERVARAADQYLKKRNQSKRMKNFKWEFNLVEDPTVNAWCMPGGKVVFYTGILPFTLDEEGLAVVMGHEIAHALARHGNERVSQQLAIQAGGIGFSVAMQDKPELTQQIFLMSYGVGSTLGALKYSRLHESEADKIGLIFMAMAGYNPDKAVDFWQRMAKAGGTHVPEILRTHPSTERRIKEIKEYLPKAKRFYKPR